MKKYISYILVFLMLITSLPLAVFAEEMNQPKLAIASVDVTPGETFEVNVNLENNPGIVSAGLKLAFDKGLTLVGATNGDVFSTLTYIPPKQLSSGGVITSACQFAWTGFDIADADIKNGSILTLTFELSDEAEIGDTFNISISSEVGDVVDRDLNEYALSAESKVTAIDYMPGDVNDDTKINMMDIVVLSRYIVDGCMYDPDGYAVRINESAAEVNADSKINMMDVVLISRYIVDGCKTVPAPDGYDVTLLPSRKTCSHSLQKTDAKEATCTEDGNIAYWQCIKCKKYFTDENGVTQISADDIVVESQGHNNVHYEATDEYTAGTYCDRCQKWTSGHEKIEINESSISYRHYVQKENGVGALEIVPDDYLASNPINNPNPSKYVEGKGIEELYQGYEIDGKKVSANGYTFVGWFEKPEIGANRVYSISPDATGNKILYGVWSKNEYTITYLPDSASSILPRVEDGTYTVDKVTSLKEPPKWPNMVWIGWSDEEGKIVKSIPKGTTGDVVLTANWMSKRSQTVPNNKYSTARPAIAVDEEKGIYTFTYEIGDIQNVPIQQVEDGVDGKGFNLVKGMTHEINKTFTQKMESGEATSVADTIANATTKSDSWTLSEDWNKSTSFSQEHANEVTEEQSQKSAMSFTESGKYSLSSGFGGSEEHVDETGTSTKTTKKHEFGVSVNAGVKAGIKAGVTAATPFKNASVEASVGLDYKYSKETEEATHETHTDTTSSYWNVNEGFEQSQELSQSAEFASSISQSIKNTYKYGETLDFGGSNSNTVSSSNTSSESREYASSVTYSQEEGKSITVAETLTADADEGYYRKVLAANFRVFAVVIYDMKSNSFSTMTYSLKIKDSEHLFTDYSTVSSFDDYENGVLPFDVPTFVADYVYGLVGKSDGLRINEVTGIVEGYGYKDPDTGICYKEYDESTDTYSNPCDTDVIIPRYIVVSVDKNEKRIVPVVGFNASAFSGTNVTSVYLSDRITAIPDGAFENCTSLKYVRGGTIDTIGKKAFKNCTSLFEFALPDIVTTLGEEAFYGVNALTVNVSNTSVFDSALANGVKKLSLDLESLEGTIDGYEIEIPENMEYFSLNGGGKTFNNVSIISESNADTIALNNITINNKADIPLKLNASKIELGFTTINASNLILRAGADNTLITLNGNNNLISAGKNAILSKNVHLIEKEDSSASGKLNVTGNVLVYGTANGTQRVTFNKPNEHTFKYLTQEEYEYMLSTRLVSFNANGGEVNISSKEIGASGTYGELPEPTKDYCSFDGWYTDAEGGTKVTAESQVSDDVEITLYAHWTPNPTSDWVLASDDLIPEDAQIVAEKWTYDFTTNIESDMDYEEGYTLYDTTSKWSEYGAWSNWSKNKAAETEARDVETKTVTDKAGYTQYRYWRYAQNGSNRIHWCDTLGKSYYGGTWYKDYTDWSNSSKNVYSSSYGSCSCHGKVTAYGPENNLYYWQETRWIAPVTHTEYRYRDRHLIYTYYHTKTEHLESEVEIFETDNINNVQKLVKYINK